MILQINFYSQYIIRKLFINLFEIKSPIWKGYRAGVMYMVSKILPRLDWTKYADINYLKTIFGKFHLRNKTFDVICAMPDFERPDVDMTIALIKSLILKNRDITYLDVGADFGLYSIILGNKFARHKNFRITAFEPFEESYNLMNKNLELNNLSEYVTTKNFGLLNKTEQLYLDVNQQNPGSNSLLSSGNCDKVSIQVMKLDEDESVSYGERDVLFMKLDIEGAEKFALEGSKDIIETFNEVYIMVEDFVDESIITYLEEVGFIFLKRVTTYNSFWYKEITQS